MKKIYLFLVLSFVAMATGCPKVVKTKPSTKFSQNTLVTQTNSYLKNQQMGYYCAISDGKVEYDYSKLEYVCKGASGTNGKEVAKRIRNEAIENGIMGVNSVYIDFIDDLNTGRATSNFIADIIDLGTSATIGIAKGERPLQILGVALTAFRGGRKSADLNFFREQATPILINKMDDNRSTTYASILLKKDKSVDEYPMQEAVRDIVDYYNAGTLIRAFTQLSKDTGAKALESEKKVLQLQKIDPADIVTIDDIDANLEYINLRKKYSAIFADGSKATDTDKSKASESLRLIYKDINKNTALGAAITKAKTDNPALLADMDKLADTDVTKADEVGGQRIISIINKIYGSLDLKTDGALVKKLVEHINAHPIKK